jgi:hypothetical protein
VDCTGDLFVGFGAFGLRSGTEGFAVKDQVPALLKKLKTLDKKYALAASNDPEGRVPPGGMFRRPLKKVSNIKTNQIDPLIKLLNTKPYKSVILANKDQYVTPDIPIDVNEKDQIIYKIKQAPLDILVTPSESGY